MGRSGDGKRNILWGWPKGISEKKSILNSPKLSEFHKKLENLPQHHFAPEKKNSSFSCSRIQ